MKNKITFRIGEHPYTDLVTHAMNFARRAADEIAFIGDGRALAHGPANLVFENPENPRVATFFEQVLR